ncbi:MAG: HD domain-containing protein [Patescibacteria group bacterium]
MQDTQNQNIIERAKETAIKLHQGQTRKDGSTPYYIHPEGVVQILEKYTDDESIICAGWLHDTLEDVSGYSYEQLEKDFGKTVAGIVREVSEDKSPDDSREKSIATWQARKTAYINNLENDSYGALMVSSADKIHNMRSMMELYERAGSRMWEAFNAPEPKIESIIWYYSEVISVLENKLKSGIVTEYRDVFENMKKLFK